MKVPTMSRLKDLVREDPIHQRVLQIQSYPVEPDRLLVEGWLKDDRQVAGFHWNGTPREPGGGALDRRAAAGGRMAPVHPRCGS